MKEVIKINQTRQYNIEIIKDIAFIYYYEDIKNKNYSIEEKSNAYFMQY